MEIKFKLDTETALKATVTIAAASGLCRVSVDTGYLQLYDPRPAPTIKKSSYTQTTMAEACYKARATTKQQVLDRIKKFTLQTNENG